MHHHDDRDQERPGARQDDALGQRLRRSLDGDPARVERLVRRALCEEREPGRRATPVPGSVPWRRVVPALALAALFLLFVLWPEIPSDEVPPIAIADLPPLSQPSTAGTAAGPTPAAMGAAGMPGTPGTPGPPEPATVRISNLGGVISVTSTGGSQWIVLPGEDS